MHMIKVKVESLDTTSWSQYLREASKGIAESSVRNDPNLGLMVDIDPSQKSIDKAVDNILNLGFKKADEYIEEVTGDHDSDSYYVFTKGSSEDDRVVMGIVFQLDNFAFINARYDKIEDADYFNESNNIKSSNIHKCDEYTVAIAKKRFGYFSKGSLVYYFIDDDTIFCYVTNNRETWICNLDVDEKDEYLRDMTDDEYNKLCQIGKSSTSTYQGSEDQKEYRLSLVENNLNNLNKALNDLRDASDERNKLNELETERALNYLNRRLAGTYYNGEHFEDETEISFRVSPKASNRIDLLSDNDPCEHILCYGPTQNGDKKVYLVFDDDNEEIGRFNNLSSLTKFIADILNDEDWFKGNKEGQLDSLVEEGVEDMIKVENAVSSELPSKVDNFLQDFAQAYGGIDYNDIIELGKNFSKVKEPVMKLIKELSADLREVGMDAYEASQEYDDIKEKCDELVKLIKNA